MKHPTFVTEDQVYQFVVLYAWTIPAIIIIGFLVMYRFVLLNWIRKEIKKRKELTNLEGRSNGHHKPKEKVNG